MINYRFNGRCGETTCECDEPEDIRRWAEETSMLNKQPAVIYQLYTVVTPVIALPAGSEIEA